MFSGSETIVNFNLSKTVYSICFFVLLPRLLQSCCWLNDPDFERDPTIIEISPTKIRVSWKDILGDIDCVDHYFIHYWKTEFEERNDVQKIHQVSENTSFNVDIDVSENTMYTIQVNAFEDGLIDCGNNWSNELIFTTSKISEFIVTFTKKGF